MVKIVLGFVAAVTLAAPAHAACRLALLLAVDVSSSVDQTEDQLQRQGLASALLAPEVQTAFFALPDPVALAVFEWSGRYNQEILLDWTMIETPADIERAAARLRQSRRSHNEFPTAMGHALHFGINMLARGPRCAAQTIDMAGDGENNEGFGPRQAYTAPGFADVTVNGLVVDAAEFQTQTELVAFYESEVLRGPGSFLEVAQGFEDYERAMRRKLERELAVPILGALPETGRSPG